MIWLDVRVGPGYTSEHTTSECQSIIIIIVRTATDREIQEGLYGCFPTAVEPDFEEDNLSGGRYLTWVWESTFESSMDKT